MKQTTLQTTIMRRIYMAFAQRLILHPVTLQAAVFVGVVWWLKELVFVAHIWQSFVTTPIGELGTFIAQVVTNADALTLLVTLAALMLLARLFTSMARWQPLSRTPSVV